MQSFTSVNHNFTGVTVTAAPRITREHRSTVFEFGFEESYVLEPVNTCLIVFDFKRELFRENIRNPVIKSCDIVSVRPESIHNPREEDFGLLLV